MSSEEMMTCTLDENEESIDYPLLFDPTKSPTPETCVIDGKGFTAKRLMKKMSDGAVEYRVFMVEDSLLNFINGKPLVLSKIANDHWERGYQAQQWHP